MPLPSAKDLAYAVEAAPATPLLAEPYYRSVDLHVVANLGVRLLDGSRSGKNGTRYNGPGGTPICYLAGSQTLAAFECEQEALILRLHRWPRNPRVTFAATISGATILDLTTQLVLQGFGLTPQELLLPSQHWQHENRQGRLAETQVLGDA
jgi:RES domain-containing protein